MVTQDTSIIPKFNEDTTFDSDLCSCAIINQLKPHESKIEIWCNICYYAQHGNPLKLYNVIEIYYTPIPQIYEIIACCDG